MLHCPDTLRACFPDLDSGCLVLTPNHLTSIQLRDWYGQWRVKTGLSPVYPSPAIFPVDIWIRQCCNRLLEAGSSLLPAVRLLEPAEEHLVWHQVISQSRVGTTLLNATATSRAVQDAWALEHLWRIARKDLEHLAPSYTASGHDDLSAYLAWSDDFRRYRPVWFCWVSRHHRLCMRSCSRPLPVFGTLPTLTCHAKPRR
jgi:hypothetical protein